MATASRDYLRLYSLQTAANHRRPNRFEWRSVRAERSVRAGRDSDHRQWFWSSLISSALYCRLVQTSWRFLQLIASKRHLSCCTVETFNLNEAYWKLGKRVQFLITMWISHFEVIWRQNLGTESFWKPATDKTMPLKSRLYRQIHKKVNSV